MRNLTRLLLLYNIQGFNAVKGFTPWKARYLEVTPTTSSFVDGLSIRIVLTFLFS